jgi:hypothetical protein
MSGVDKIQETKESLRGRCSSLYRGVGVYTGSASSSIASTILKVGEGEEAVDLQFADEVAGVERRESAGAPHGA